MREHSSPHSKRISLRRRLVIASLALGTASCALILGLPDPSLDEGAAGAQPEGGTQQPTDALVGPEALPPLADGGCISSRTLCAGACVDTTADPSHCGACNRSCRGASCAGSACVAETLDRNAAYGWRLAIDDERIYWIGFGSTQSPTDPTGVAAPGRLVRIGKDGGDRVEVTTPRPVFLAVGQAVFVLTAGPNAPGSTFGDRQLLLYPRSFTANQSGLPVGQMPATPLGYGMRGGMFLSDGGSPGVIGSEGANNNSGTIAVVPPGDQLTNVNPALVAIAGNANPDQTPFYVALRDLTDSGAASGVYAMTRSTQRTLVYDAGDVGPMVLAGNKLIARRFREIVAIDLGAKNVSVVISGLSGNDLSQTDSLAFDPAANRVYYADPAIYRVDADGSGKLMLAPAPPSGGVVAMAVDRDYVYWLELTRFEDGGIVGSLRRTVK
jgi:hypothetical protein